MSSKKPLPYQRGIGAIGAPKMQKLTDAGLVVLFAVEYERLKQRIDELERRVKALREETPR